MFSDVNGDGLNELVVTLTDRVVRTYQWRTFPNKEFYKGELAALAKWEFGHQIGGSALLPNPSEPILYVTQAGTEIHKLKLTDPQTIQLETIHPMNNPTNSAPEIIYGNGGIAIVSDDSVAFLKDDDKLVWQIKVLRMLII